MNQEIKKAQIDELFKKVVTRLEGENVQFAVCGGIAVSLYRVQKRTTEDIDLLLLAENRSQEVAKEIVESFGLKAGLARKADLEGGPLFAKKRRTSTPYIVVGRNPEDPDAVGIDFVLPEMPWFHQALQRAQENKVDYGFGPVPTITIEDMIISKFHSLRDKSTRFKDLDDLQQIFSGKHEIDMKYLTGQMRELELTVPLSLSSEVPDILRKTSKDIERERKKELQKGHGRGR